MTAPTPNEGPEYELFSATNTREDLGRLVAAIFGPRPDGGEGGNVAGGAS